MKCRGEKLPGFGQRLKECRLDAGITQQQAADALNVTLRTYQRYESGDTEPTLYDLVSLCVVVGATSDKLLGLEDR